MGIYPVSNFGRRQEEAMLRILDMGFEFELDVDQSEIYAFLSHAEPARSPTWSIDVRCGPARLLPLEGES